MYMCVACNCGLFVQGKELLKLLQEYLIFEGGGGQNEIMSIVAS